MKTKDFILNCTTRQFVLLLDMVKNSIDNLNSNLSLFDIDSKDSKVYNDYLVLYDKLKDLYK